MPPKREPLLTKQECINFWPVIIVKPPIQSADVIEYARRIESLVRKRLAERLRAGDTGSDDWNSREAAACIVEKD